MLESIKPSRKLIFLYCLIPVAIYLFSVFMPLIVAFIYSFFEWRGGPQRTFTGLSNYATLINDARFWESFGHNIYLVAVCIVGQIGIAFVLVLMAASLILRMTVLLTESCASG